MKSHRSRFAASTLALTAALAAAVMQPAGAQQTPLAPVEPQPMQGTPAARSDRSFISDMLQQARLQLALAQLVRERSSDQMALSAADDAAAQWSTLQGRLTALAVATGAPVRGTLGAREHDELWQLARTPVRDLRWAYLRDVQRGDRLAFAAFRAEDGTLDPRVQAFINDARPLMTAAEAPITADLQQAPPAQTATVDIRVIEPQ